MESCSEKKITGFKGYMWEIRYLGITVWLHESGIFMEQIWKLTQVWLYGHVTLKATEYSDDCYTCIKYLFI